MVVTGKRGGSPTRHSVRSISTQGNSVEKDNHLSTKPEDRSARPTRSPTGYRFQSHASPSERAAWQHELHGLLLAIGRCGCQSSTGWSRTF